MNVSSARARPAHAEIQNRDAKLAVECQNRDAKFTPLSFCTRCESVSQATSRKTPKISEKNRNFASSIRLRYVCTYAYLEKVVTSATLFSIPPGTRVLVTSKVPPWYVHTEIRTRQKVVT